MDIVRGRGVGRDDGEVIFQLCDNEAEGCTCTYVSFISPLGAAPRGLRTSRPSPCSRTPSITRPSYCTTSPVLGGVLSVPAETLLSLDNDKYFALQYMYHHTGFPLQTRTQHVSGRRRGSRAARDVAFCVAVFRRPCRQRAREIVGVVREDLPILSVTVLAAHWIVNRAAVVDR